MKKVIIVGSGLAGMTAAFRLQQQGWDVQLLEKEPRAGGRVLSHQREDGFILDAGPTLISDKYTEYLKLVNELGLDHLLIDSSPVMGVMKGQELHVLDMTKPIRAFTTTKLLSTRLKLKLIVKGLALLKPLRKLNPYELSSHIHYDTISMEAYLNQVFGAELNDSLLAAVARGVTLSTPDDASVIEFFAGAVAASGKMQNLLGGMEVLPQTLATKLNIKLEADVNAVQRTDSGVEVTYQEAGRTLSEQADACIITTPFRHAADIYPRFKETGAQLYEKTIYNGCYSMQLMYRRRTEKDPFIVLVPTSTSKEISVLFQEHIKAPDRAPEGKSQITVFFNLKSDIDFASWDDNQFETISRAFVESLFPELGGQFIDSHLTRWDYAAHLGNVGYYKALDAFLRAHPSDESVQAAGDYMAVSGQESAVVAGVNAARRLIENH